MERTADDPAAESAGDPPHHEAPKINFSAALGEAGHEVEDLGFEGVPDTAPVIEDHTAGERIVDPERGLDVPIIDSQSD